MIEQQNEDNESHKWFVETVQSHPNSIILQNKENEIIKTSEESAEQDKKDPIF